MWEVWHWWVNLVWWALTPPGIWLNVSKLSNVDLVLLTYSHHIILVLLWIIQITFLHVLIIRAVLWFFLSSFCCALILAEFPLKWGRAMSTFLDIKLVCTIYLICFAQLLLIFSWNPISQSEGPPLPLLCGFWLPKEHFAYQEQYIPNTIMNKK